MKFLTGNAVPRQAGTHCEAQNESKKEGVRSKLHHLGLFPIKYFRAVFRAVF